MSVENRRASVPGVKPTSNASKYIIEVRAMWGCISLRTGQHSKFEFAFFIFTITQSYNFVARGLMNHGLSMVPPGVIFQQPPGDTSYGENSPIVNAKQAPYAGAKGANMADMSGEKDTLQYVQPLMAAIQALTDQMRAMSSVLQDVHEMSFRHSATLDEHSSSIQRMSRFQDSRPTDPESKPHSNYSMSQAPTREATPSVTPPYPSMFPQVNLFAPPGVVPPVIASYQPQPNRSVLDTSSLSHAPSDNRKTLSRTDEMTRSTMSLHQGVNRSVVSTSMTPNSARRSARYLEDTRSSRGRSNSAPRNMVIRAPVLRQPVPTTKSSSRSRSSSQVTTSRSAAVAARSRLSTTPTAIPTPAAPAARPSTPLLQYDVEVSYNDRVFGRSHVKSSMIQDGPFLYVVQSELSPAVSFIPPPADESPCAFTGVAVSVIATNNRSKKSTIVFKSHASHVDNPPVNEVDGYLSHSCWLSGPSASVVGGLRVFYRVNQPEQESITLYAMSLKFWFPEDTGSIAKAPSFTKENWKELLRLLGLF